VANAYNPNRVGCLQEMYDIKEELKAANRRADEDGVACAPYVE